MAEFELIRVRPGMEMVRTNPALGLVEYEDAGLNTHPERGDYHYPPYIRRDLFEALEVNYRYFPEASSRFLNEAQRREYKKVIINHFIRGDQMPVHTLLRVEQRLADLNDEINENRAAHYEEQLREQEMLRPRNLEHPPVQLPRGNDDLEHLGAVGGQPPRGVNFHQFPNVIINPPNPERDPERQPLRPGQGFGQGGNRPPRGDPVRGNFRTPGGDFNAELANAMVNTAYDLVADLQNQILTYEREIQQLRGVDPNRESFFGSLKTAAEAVAAPEGQRGPKLAALRQFNLDKSVSGEAHDLKQALAKTYMDISLPKTSEVSVSPPPNVPQFGRPPDLKVFKNLAAFLNNKFFDSKGTQPVSIQEFLEFINSLILSEHLGRDGVIQILKRSVHESLVWMVVGFDKSKSDLTTIYDQLQRYLGGLLSFSGARAKIAQVIENPPFDSVVLNLEAIFKVCQNTADLSPDFAFKLAISDSTFFLQKNCGRALAETIHREMVNVTRLDHSITPVGEGLLFLQLAKERCAHKNLKRNSGGQTEQKPRPNSDKKPKSKVKNQEGGGKPPQSQKKEDFSDTSSEKSKKKNNNNNTPNKGKWPNSKGDGYRRWDNKRNDRQGGYQGQGYPRGPPPNSGPPPRNWNEPPPPRDWDRERRGGNQWGRERGPQGGPEQVNHLHHIAATSSPQETFADPDQVSSSIIEQPRNDPPALTIECVGCQSDKMTDWKQNCSLCREKINTFLA